MGGLRIGSLCSGYRGLDMAVEAVFGASTAWVSDVDPGANKILAHHWPDTPNIGDLTTARWEDVEPIDILCGGYPCQPFSSAGLRKGTEDERHIWPYIADALRVLRPRLAVFENVAGHLRLGFDTVLADLAGLGFDAEWCLVRASEVGAPHPRQRLFIVAVAQDSDGKPWGERGVAASGQAEVRGAWSDARGRGGAPAANADGRGLAGDAERDGRPEDGQPECASGLDADGRGLQRAVAADADSIGRGSTESDVRPGQPDAVWGRFLFAVQRWERVTGRRAPRATDDRNRLSPRFVEWMMGLPAGHVTDVPGLSSAAQLKALGNGVVPQQAEAAIRLLYARAAEHVRKPFAVAA
ncbi:DNA cytosine methyltransferase [Streptomyces olivaceus]|nr:DNA cytosine methyltransferase [Streptomyces olivaceus]